MKMKVSTTNFLLVSEKEKHKIAVDNSVFTVKPKHGGIILVKTISTKNIVKDDDKSIVFVTEKNLNTILRTTD